MHRRGCTWFALGCLSIVVLTYLVVLVVTKTVFPAYRNDSGAMEPTLAVGDNVITNRSSNVTRGDMIVFRYPQKPDTMFVKRVVGLPGERIEIRSKKVYVNGTELSEPYASHVDENVLPNNPALPEPYRSRDHFGPFTVPAERFFVLGDNRDRSSDSCYWGPVPRENIGGQVILVISRQNGVWRP